MTAFNKNSTSISKKTNSRPVAFRRSAISAAAIEALEDRKLFSVLTITGATPADTLALSQTTNSIVVQDNSTTKSYPSAGVKQIKVNASAGNDTITIASSITETTVVNGGNGNDTITAKNASDSIYGGAGNDIITVTKGNNFVDGGGGSNIIYGGTGNDTLQGGAGGYNEIFAGKGNELIYGNEAPPAPPKPTKPPVPKNNPGGKPILFTVPSTKTVKITTKTPAPLVVPVADLTGNYIVCGNGRDTAFGGIGNDTIEGGAGNDSIYGGTGNNVLYAGTGNTQVVGGAGNDTIYGSFVGGNDLLCAGTGDDTIYGNTSNDMIEGGIGNDLIYAGNGNTTVAGCMGNDSIYGGTGNDVLYAGTWNDSIYGGSGNDSLYGGTGNDLIYAGNGQTAVYSGTGVDTINGGTGNDTFVTVGGSNKNVINGGGGFNSYWVGTGDTINDANYSAEAAAGNIHRIASFQSETVVNSYGGSTTTTVPLTRDDPSLSLPEPNDTLPGSGPTPTKGPFPYASFSNDPLFAPSGANQNDVIQCSVGDCYFMSGLAAIAKANPNRIEQSVVNLGDGTYAVQFFSGGTPLYYRVDAELPVLSGTNTLACTKTGADNCLWCPIIEKAFTFYRADHAADPVSGGLGTYNSIQGGQFGEPFQEVVNSVPITVWVPGNADATLALIGQYLADGYAITTSTKGTLPSGAPAFANHVYTVESVNCAGGKPVSITLRNPFGDKGPPNNNSLTDGGYGTLTLAQFFGAFQGAVMAWVQ